MPHIWVEFAERLAERLPRDGQVTMTIDEIIQETGTTDQTIRDRGTWLAVQRGDKYSDTLTNAGLAIDFHPNERGKPVETVTFRLA